ncbi:MAG: homogentisate 1,2-dioxygenase [Legionellales bacterium]|nr:homogentisate 1,2-dioxygenase [Legionellales bacterium]|tara:strand:- start:14529 stop:15824 length:1296 start_codon:yes stop_codon:yes gene_type:complete
MQEKFNYQQGFGNHFSTEALAGALPEGQNSPQKPAYGLYTEQLSGTSFTTPRETNQRSWLYRIQPSVTQGGFQPLKHKRLCQSFNEGPANPTQCRWDPLPYPKKPTDFVQGLVTFAGHGNCRLHTGAAIHLYAINASMEDSFFYNADGEFLIVPQEGELLLRTEFGLLSVAPGEIAVIPRGVKYQVHLYQDQARGYICENFGANFRLPELGPIGANGLANPRDFQVPVAFYEEIDSECKLLTKFQGALWQTTTPHSPLNVVAWHGNYTPYKYNLTHFNTINTVSWDHPDPSIFTVLSAPSNTPGVANVDFVIFPERWMVAEHTFRPPYYHRNIMSEFMGLIKGNYDAKSSGFVPGGASLHNCMTPHGPDKASYIEASEVELTPTYYKDTLAFMFESYFSWTPTTFAKDSKQLQKDYLQCWQGLPRQFEHNR